MPVMLGRRLLIAVSACAGTLIAESGASAQQVDLRPRFKAGQELRYTMTLKGVNDSKIDGLPEASQKQVSDQRIDFHLKVVSSDSEKGSTVQLVYDALQLKLQAGDTKVEFDSTKPAKKPAAPKAKAPAGSPPATDPLADASTDQLDSVLRSLVGTTLTLTVAPDGTITQVTGGEQLAGALAMAGSGQLADPQGVRDLFGPVLSTRATKAQAKVGETWQHVDKVEVGLLGNLKITTNYKLASAAGSTATVKFDGKIDLDSEASAQTPTFKLNDTRYEGSYLWDTEAGALRSLDQVQAFTLEGNTQGMKMNLRSDATVKITRR